MGSAKLRARWRQIDIMRRACEEGLGQKVSTDDGKPSKGEYDDGRQWPGHEVWKDEWKSGQVSSTATDDWHRWEGEQDCVQDAGERGRQWCGGGRWHGRDGGNTSIEDGFHQACYEGKMREVEREVKERPWLLFKTSGYNGLSLRAKDYACLGWQGGNEDARQIMRFLEMEEERCLIEVEDNGADQSSVESCKRRRYAGGD